jgi:hypothetical protein
MQVKMLLSNYIKYFDEGLPDDLCRETIKLMEENPQNHHSHNGCLLFSDVDSEFRTNLSAPILSSVGSYSALVPQYVVNSLRLKSSEIEHVVVTKIPKGEGAKVFFDNYGTPKRRLAMMYHLNTVSGGNIKFEHAGIETQQVQGYLTVFPYAWLYEYSIAPADEDQYILMTYLRLKDEAAAV